MRLEDCNAGDTDKGSSAHNYLPFYECHLEPDKISVLTEIGVWQGGSLRMWQRWIPHARVIGIDIEPANYGHPSEWTGKAPEFVAGDATKIDPWITDVLIDDGSHKGTDISSAFDRWWPYVTPGGWYVIEDLRCLYGVQFAGEVALEAIQEALDATFKGEPSQYAPYAAVSEFHAYKEIVFLRKRA